VGQDHPALVESLGTRRAHEVTLEYLLHRRTRYPRQEGHRAHAQSDGWKDEVDQTGGP
jgi:hypothetical protein